MHGHSADRWLAAGNISSFQPPSVVPKYPDKNRNDNGHPAKGMNAPEKRAQQKQLSFEDLNLLSDPGVLPRS